MQTLTWSPQLQLTVRNSKKESVTENKMLSPSENAAVRTVLNKEGLKAKVQQLWWS
jgi:hypothetical protein